MAIGKTHGTSKPSNSVLKVTASAGRHLSQTTETKTGSLSIRGLPTNPHTNTAPAPPFKKQINCSCLEDMPYPR